MDDIHHHGGRRPARTPQGEVNDFWSSFSRKRPSKVTSIFPRLLYASLLPRHDDPRGASSARNAAESYDIAAKECREMVKRIREECERTNEKFTDPDFDIESDFETKNNCLFGLHPPRPPPPPPDNMTVTSIARSISSHSSHPGSVHRLDWIFRNPQFTVNGYSHTDVQQGIGGDCWWLAAISTIAHRKDLMDRICVARDEECGVYGFVFQRDGEWISVIVDDNLYLSSEDFRDLHPEDFDPDGSKAAKFKMLNQRGSEALFFSRCTEENETWLPLLEKAYAKAHNDYEAIDGGYVGDGVEDMTGGVTTPIATNKVLRKDRLWKELSGSDGQFVFGISAHSRFGRVEADSGVTLGHAYTILRAVEEDTEDGKSSVRLVKIRNPWGKRDVRGREGEWNGRWSDGSEEWTPYWMAKLDHRFKNDGIFWMEYSDMLATFKYIYRTRLFDENWTVIQQWASCSVSWVTGYLRTKFLLDVKKAGMVVIVLAQLDERYFKGLEGQYKFSLHFIVQKQGSQIGDYICRVRPVPGGDHRSISCEIENLEEGQYEVIPQITAVRFKQEQTVEYLVPRYANTNPQKLRQVGLQYDLAHAKGGIPDEDMELERKNPKLKKKLFKKSRHPHIRGRLVEFELDVMPQQEQTPSERSHSRLEEKDQFDEFQDATEGPTAETKPSFEYREDDGHENPRDSSREKLAMQNGEQQQGHEPGEPEERGENLPTNSNEGGPVVEDDKNLSTNEHFDVHSADESSDSDSVGNDDRRWNAVCIACLRVYSRDPELTITLVSPDDRQGSSNLVRGQEPAGATM
ncbi:hypothetical protein N8I77_001460 [Diaporthe amygdali]|uniref:Calpain catalytic domain-containing protein n=1 Tax=Phomopsis amygdali TaxID=1214568 RepID=A0AAD9SS08_PHOAM|nr:hypothetical protein N8I77_001460 [Diaporthe amygdali]